METELERKQLPDLKGLCKTFGLQATGTKERIIRRLVDFFILDGNEHLWAKVFSQDLINNMNTRKNSSLSCCINPKNDALIYCTECSLCQHRTCMGINAKLTPYLCPRCILTKINPLNLVVEVLVSPWLVKDCPVSGSNCEVIEKVFEVSHETRANILRGLGSVQIQVRCIKMDGKSLMMSWPSKGYLVVNNKIAIKLEVSSNPNAKKRKDEPLNITQIVDPGQNSISLIQTNDSHSYYISVFTIERKSEDHFIEEVQKNNILTKDKSIEFIKNNLRLGDSEIAPSSIKFSLKCPMTMTIIKIPVRGKNCKHIQCFNLEPYVKMQRTSRVNRWCCPVCKEFVYDLVYDLYLKEILDSAQCIKDSEAVEIYPDTNFRIILGEEIGKKDSDSLPRKRLINETSNLIKAPRFEDSDIIELD